MKRYLIISNSGAVSSADLNRAGVAWLERGGYTVTLHPVQNTTSSPVLASLKADLRQLKREMKARRVRVVSCFNGGLSPLEHSYNKQLFALKLGIARELHLSA